jgi:hypothetical protein
MHTSRRLALTGALLAIGVAAGGYGVAGAANGPGPGAGCIVATSGAPAPPSPAQQQWCGQGSDETLLTGKAKSKDEFSGKAKSKDELSGKTKSKLELTGKTKRKVEAAANARFPGAAIVRTETDADGSDVYEVHMVRADGTPATVYVDRQFDVVGVQTGTPAPTQRP